VKFLADECVDARVIEELTAAGHDIRSVRETAAGLTDARVLELASEEGRILLTEDKDFGELAFRLRHRAVAGIVLLRIDPAARQQKGARMIAAIDRFGEELSGRYSVVHENRFRTRPLI
jgi:predicted nuclease of predicted toxin-antitoxin system